MICAWCLLGTNLSAKSTGLTTDSHGGVVLSLLIYLLNLLGVFNNHSEFSLFVPAKKSACLGAQREKATRSVAKGIDVK